MSAPTQDTERDDQGPQLKDKRPPLSPIRRRSMGVALILVMLLIVGLCLANFNKVFKPTETVYLRTATVGNQLSKQGDVKVRGVIVGEITSIDSDGSGAVIEMAMSPDFLPTIPSNTTATLIPKTLFGERYVSLSIPPDASPRPLQEGDTIAQDRSSNATETEQVLNNLLPVLTAVQPEKLSDTLGAVSQALSGRGEQLGNTLVLLNQYVEGLNPSLPDLQANLRALAPTADIYNQASPDLIARAGQPRDDEPDPGRGARGVRVDLPDGDVGVRHDDGLPGREPGEHHRARGHVAADPRAAGAVQLGVPVPVPAAHRPHARRSMRSCARTTGIQIDAEITIDNGKYVPGEEPRYLDTRGPRCYQIEGQAPQFPPGGPIKDGSTPPDPSRSTQDAYAGGQAGEIDDESQTGDDSPASARSGGRTEGQSAPGRVDGANIGLPNTPNSPEERQLVTEVTAMQMGVTPSQVPSFAPYLSAATLRGAQAEFR